MAGRLPGVCRMGQAGPGLPTPDPSTVIGALFHIQNTLFPSAAPPPNADTRTIVRAAYLFYGMTRKKNVNFAGFRILNFFEKVPRVWFACLAWLRSPTASSSCAQLIRRHFQQQILHPITLNELSASEPLTIACRPTMLGSASFAAPACPSSLLLSLL